MLRIIVGLVVVGVILYIFFGIWGIIVPAVLFVVAILVIIKDANKMSAPPKISVINNPNVENILQSHPELGNYKRYYGGQGILLILSENGYVAYFQGENFTIKKIDEVRA